MINGSNDLKFKVIQAIEEKVPTKRTGVNELRIRCVFCGDSHNRKEGHLYLKCSTDPTEPILYYCFKCNAKGMVTSKFLTLLGIDIPEGMELNSKRFNRLATIKNTTVEMITGTPKLDSDQVGYTEYRLGDGLTLADYERFKIVWDMNLIVPLVSSIRVRNSLPSNKDSISFLSDDRSMLLTRTFDDIPPRWYKRKLFPSSNRSFYTIKSEIDLFTNNNITINIAEGIYDILSIYKNFPTGDNSVYIACLGTDYIAALEHTILLGMIGSNIYVKIYIDSDIDPKFLKYQSRKFKWITGSIKIIKNSIEKDFGYTIDKIIPIEL